MGGITEDPGSVVCDEISAGDQGHYIPSGGMFQAKAKTSENTQEVLQPANVAVAFCGRGDGGRDGTLRIIWD